MSDFACKKCGAEIARRNGICPYPCAALKPLIYVAGPISKGWLPTNIRNACVVGKSIEAQGGIPLVPHTMAMWDLVQPQEYEFWMKLCLAYIPRCDGLYLMRGESPGAERERDLSVSLAQPVWVEHGPNDASLGRFPNFIERCRAVAEERHELLNGFEPFPA